MLKVLSPSIAVIGSVLMSLLEITLACDSFNFVCNIVVGNVLVFFLEVILPNDRSILPYNVLKCLLYVKIKFNMC